MTNYRIFVAALAVTILVGCSAQREQSNPEPEEASVTKTNMTNTMKVVRVGIEIKPERVDEFRAYMSSESESVREFSGCERYELFSATDKPNTFLLYQEWKSADAFKAFQASPQLKQSFAVLGPMMAGPPDSAYFDAVRVE